MKAKTETIARALEGLTPRRLHESALLNATPKPTCTRRSTAGPSCFNSYDVTGMTLVTSPKADDPAKFIDVFLRHDHPFIAFGVYSVERPSGSKAIATGDGGHRSGADLFFRKGQYYVARSRHRDPTNTSRKVSALADTLANRLKAQKASELWGLAMLPAKNRIDDSVQYLMVDALGLDFLTNAFTAQYRDGEAEFHRLPCRALQTGYWPQKSRSKYKAHLEEFGDMAQPAKIEVASVMSSPRRGGVFDGRLRCRRRGLQFSADRVWDSRFVVWSPPPRSGFQFAWCSELEHRNCRHCRRPTAA